MPSPIFPRSLRLSSRLMGRPLPLLAGLLAALCVSADAVRGEETTQIITGLRSANELRDDLRFLVSDLAAEPATFDELLDPFLETLLYGVDPRRPHRFDAVLSTDETFTLLMMVPLSDADEFIEENLEPVGIDVRRQRRRSGGYELGGQVYEGVMQIVGGDSGYAMIARDKDYLPGKGDADMLGRVVPKLLAEPNWDFGLHIGEASGPADQRARVAAASKKRRLDALSRKADETPAAFALRKLLASHQSDRLARILTGVADLSFRFEIDTEGRNSQSSLAITPEAGSDLADAVAQISTKPYRFGDIEPSKQSVLTGRMQYVITDSRRASLRESLEAARPVAREQIESSSGTADQKQARQQLSDLIYDQLTDGTTQDAVDLFGDIAPAAGGHVGVMGISTAGTEKVGQMLDLLAASYDGFSVTKNVGEATTADGETLTLHRVTLPDSAPSLTKFFGTREGLLAVGSNTVYAAIGEGAEDALKTAAAKVDKAGEPLPALGSLTMSAAPIMGLVNDMLESNEASLIDFLRRRREQRNPNADRRVQVGDPAAYRRVFLEALRRGDDTIRLSMDKQGDGLAGQGFAGEAVLRGIGEVIAKFSEDNLR